MLRQLGGPGPATSAFRQLLRRQAAVSASASTFARKARKSKSKTKTVPHAASPFRNEADSKAALDKIYLENFNSGKAPERRAKLPGKEVATEPNPATTGVFAALPPIKASGVETKERELVRHLAYQEVPQALEVWEYLSATNTAGTLHASTYESISNFVGEILAGRHGIDVGHWAVQEPQMLATLTNMATEAAVHDSWRGYSTLQLQFIGVGRPHEVVASYAQFKERAWEYQGKDPKNLADADREVRLGSRLTGEGLIPLLFGNLAALTMLNQFDNATINSLLDSNFNPHDLDSKRIDLTPIRDQFRTKVNRAASDTLWTQFLTNVRKYRLAILCYHSMALIFRIRAYAQQNETRYVDRTYEEVMEASIGPDSFIVHVDPDSKIQRFTIVPLQMMVWNTFMMAYARLGDFEKIIRLVDVDMAARYARVPTAGYQEAMRDLSRVVERSKHLKSDQRRRIVVKIEEYWARVVARGEDMRFESLLSRVESLNNLDKLRDAEQVYRRGVMSLRREGHPGVLHLTGSMFFAYCQAGRIEEAQKLLNGVQGLPPAPEAERVRAFRPFVMGCISAQATHDMKRRLLTQVMQHAGDHIAPALWGLILQFHLSGSGEKDVAATCDVFATKQHGVATQWWYDLLSGLLRDGSKNHLPEAVLIAGVHILQKLFPRDHTASPFRTRAAWTVVLSAIARSEIVSASERHRLIKEVMACLPHPQYESTLRWRIMLIALQRPDRTGIPEALHQWRLAKHRAPPNSFMTLMSQLLRLGHKSTARDVAADIPYEPRYRSALAYAQQKGLYAGHLPSNRFKPRAVEVDRSASVERELEPDEDADASATEAEDALELSD